MIAEALDEIGPCLSNVLIDHLVAGGLARATARQRIHRHPDVLAIDGLTFARGARFIHLTKHKNTVKLRKALRDAILSSGGAYARAVTAVGLRRVVPIWQFPAASGSPLQRKGQLGSEDVMTRLVSVGLFTIVDVPSLGPSITMSDRSNTIPTIEISTAVARNSVEVSLLEAMREWARRLNFSSWDAAVVRQPDAASPEVGSFAWDMTCPSYLLPLRRWKEGKSQPGFIVCDVFNGTVSGDAMNVFLHKCDSLRHLKNLAPVLPIFVADRYDNEALRSARGAGVIPATIQSLFGPEFAVALRDLTRVLSNALREALDVGQLAEIVKRLSKVEGALGNLRGTLFEYLVADIVRGQSPGTPIEMNRRCKGPDGVQMEVDVWAFNATTARFIECKSHRPGSMVADNEIEQWLKKRIPAVRHYLEQMSHLQSVPRPEFELWVMGELSVQSLERIQRTTEANINKFSIKVIKAADVMNYAAAASNGSLADTLKLLFIDPLP